MHHAEQKCTHFFSEWYIVHLEPMSEWLNLMALVRHLCNPCNHNPYIRISIFPHICNRESSTGNNWFKKWFKKRKNWGHQFSFWATLHQFLIYLQQGKSEGFESCDRPIVRKRPIWVNIGDVLYRVTLKFDGWPWKIKGHLSFAVSNFVQHYITIGELKLELQSGNAQFGSNLTIFRAVWPWNLTHDLKKQ